MSKMSYKYEKQNESLNNSYMGTPPKPFIMRKIKKNEVDLIFQHKMPIEY